jgi:hypothetical protein
VVVGDDDDGDVSTLLEVADEIEAAPTLTHDMMID